MKVLQNILRISTRKITSIVNINKTVKGIMKLKKHVGEFSLDLYYDDLSAETPYVAKIHRGDFAYHGRGKSFEEALWQIGLYLEKLLASGLTFDDIAKGRHGYDIL